MKSISDFDFSGGVISGEKIQQMAKVSFCKSFNDIINNQLRSFCSTYRKDITVLLIDALSGEEFQEKYDGKCVFCYTHDVKYFLDRFLPYIQKGIVLITHNSDAGIDQSHRGYLETDKIVWLAQNAYIEHDNLIGLPIGIANSQWPHGNQNAMIEVKKMLMAGQIKKEPGRIYKNFSLDTNPRARYYVDRVTAANGITMDCNRPYKDYLIEVAKSQCVISPPGNGLDCHRTWEAMALDALPVIEVDGDNAKAWAHTMFMFGRDINAYPCIQVKRDEWSKITPEFVQQSYNHDLHTWSKMFSLTWGNSVKDDVEMAKEHLFLDQIFKNESHELFTVSEQ